MLRVSMGSDRTVDAKEAKQLCKAELVALKCKGLPVSRRMLRRLCASASAAAGKWGWVQKAPPQYACKRLDTIWKDVGSRLLLACAFLIR